MKRDRSAYMAAYMRDVYRVRKANAGLCSRCGARPARGGPNLLETCKRCNATGLVRMRRSRVKAQVRKLLGVKQ